MGNEQSRIVDEAINVLEKQAQDSLNENSENTTTETADATIITKELDRKLNFNGAYTELKTLGKHTLAWKTASIFDSGNRNLKASLRRYRIKLDKIYGLCKNDDGTFTISALSTKDDNVKEPETLIEKVRYSGHALVNKVNPFRPKGWYQNDYTFEPEDPDQSTLWLDELCTLTNSDWEERKMMIVWNPLHEKGHALQVLEKIEPMFDAAGIQLTLKETENIQETIYTAKKLLNYSAVVVIGNDETVEQAINGILSRNDWDEIAPKVSLGVIPCGKGNSTSKFLGVTHPYLAALNIIRGVPQPMDIMSMTNATGYRTFSHLHIHWGFFADLKANAKNSLVYQWLGFQMYALMQSLSVPVYQGRLHYLPMNSESKEMSDPYKPALPKNEAERLAKRGPLDRFDKVKLEYLPSEWKTLDAAFSVFSASNNPWIHSDCTTTPIAYSNDGAVDMIFSQCGFWGLLPWILFPTKNVHLTLPWWNYQRVCAFILEPGKGLNDEQGHLEVDGKQIPSEMIRCEVHKGLLYLLTPQRKVDSRQQKQKQQESEWMQLTEMNRWKMIDFEHYKSQFIWFWIAAFALLILAVAHIMML